MNDQRITDYALGELAESSRISFEKELAASAELQAELRDIIALAEALPGGMASDEGLTVTVGEVSSSS